MIVEIYFSMSRDLMLITKGHVALRMGTCHCKLEPCLLGVYEFSAGGDIMYLICHVLPHDHYTKGSRKFMGGSSWYYIITLISLMTISIVIVEICFQFVT